MARGMKKDDALALAGSVAAKAVYNALEEAEEKKEASARDSKEVPAAPGKDPREGPVQTRDRRSPDDDDNDDEEDDRPSTAVHTAFRQSRRPGGPLPVSGPRQFQHPGPSQFRPRSPFGGTSGAGFDRTSWQMSEDEENYKSSHDVRQVLDSIPKNERASVLFKFRQRRLIGSGKVMFRPIMEWNAVGDPAEWQARIRVELAGRGPGLYEGIPYTTEGKPIPEETHWVFEIKEEEARDAGWLPDEEKEKSVVNAMPVVPAPGSGHVQVAEPNDDDMEKLAKREKARIDYLKNQHECLKIENAIAQERDGGKKGQSSEASSKDSYSEEATKRIIEAEKARLAAEHKAELAKLEADRKAELAKLEADRERAETRLKNESEVERRKAEDALRDLKNEMSKKEAEHASKLSDLQRGLEKQFEDKFKSLEKTLKDQEESERKREKVPERKAEETAVAVATALTNAFSPILMPLMNAWASKLATAPAPVVPTPDPVKQMESMASIFSPILEKLANPPPPPVVAPPVDTMAIVTQTMSMFKDAMPKPDRGPRPEELADMVARAVEAKLPQSPQAAQDPFQFADRVLGYAKGMADTMSQSRGGGSEERDDPTDQFEIMEKGFDRLRKFGVPVTIGVPQTTAATSEPEKPNLVGEIFAGVKETLPAFGDAVAKYMNSRQPQVDPSLLREVQIAQLKKKTELRRKASPGQQQVQRPPQAQRPQPPQVQQAPVVQRQFVPQSPVVPQPRLQPAAVARPQATQQPVPQQPVAQPVAPQPQQAAQSQVVSRSPQSAQKNRFLPSAAAPYGLPTEVINRRPPPPPAFKPVEQIPRRTTQPQAEQKNGVPVTMVPINKQPGGNPESRIPVQGIPTAASQPQVAQRQPVAQQAATQQVAAPASEAPLEELDAEGLPTMKVWGELATYAIASIDKNEDTDVAALYLMEHFPKAANLVRNVIGSMGVEGLDALLMNYSHHAGPSAEVLAALASKIRNQGKDWTVRLVASLKGSSGVTETAG